MSRLFCEACRDPCLWHELSVLYSDFVEDRWNIFLHWLAARACGLRTLVLEYSMVRNSAGFSKLLTPFSAFAAAEPIVSE